MGVIIKRAVRVKVVVTGEFKRRRAEEARTALARLDEVAKRLDFELGSLAKRADKGAEEKARIGERLEQTRRRNERTRAAMARELEMVESLDIGSEHDRGAVEGLVEVNVGDDFSKLASCEIVVKDDRIIEIRDGICPETGETSLQGG
jgi:hypothetical protein